MKKQTAVVLALLVAAAASADTTSRVVTGNVLNLYSLQKTQLKGTYSPPWGTYTPPCSLNTDTLNRYDFVYQDYDLCSCICPCCPEIRITSPRAFYRSNAPMSHTAFSPSLLGAMFTKISGPDGGGGLLCSALPSVTYGHTGTLNPTPIDSMRSRLFVFLSNNGGQMPFYVYMLVHVDTLLPYQYWCNPNEPDPGGQYYPLYDTARISIYNTGIVASVKPVEQSVNYRSVSKKLEIYSIMGKRVDNMRLNMLPAGIYLINGKISFLQKNTTQFNRLTSIR
jgi:hypothetical protein